MIVVFFLLGALALLVTVLLFGFVGCAIARSGSVMVLLMTMRTIPQPSSRQPDLVAYWRLGEPASTPVPSSGGAAKSQVGGFDGDYDLMPAVITPDGPTHSPINRRHDHPRGKARTSPALVPQSVH